MQPGSRINFSELAANLDIAARNYWKNRLQSVEPLPGFDLASAEYREYTFAFPQPVTGWLQTVAASPKARHVLLMTSLGILLHKYFGATDIMLFTTTYTGNAADEESETVPVRMNNLFAGSFREALLQMREAIVQDMEYGHYPFEKKLNQHPGDSVAQPVALLMEEIQQERGLEKLQPSLLCRVSASCALVIKTRLNENELQRLVSAWFHVLESIAANPQVTINDITIFHEPDLQSLLYRYNHTEADYPRHKTIVDLFEEQAGKTPGSIALLYGSVAINYSQLKQQVDGIAHYLLTRHQLQPGDVVGLLLDRQPLLVAAMLGILKAGAAYIPVDPGYPAKRIQAIIDDAGMKLLITTAMYRQLKSLPDIRIAAAEELERYLKQSPVKAFESVAQPDGLAYVIYTSGSTGKPKGVMIEHRSLVNYIYWAAQCYVRGDEAVFPLYTSVSFDLTVTSVYTPLISGNAILIYPEQDRELLVNKVFADNVATIIKLTPSHLQIIRDNPALKWTAGDNIKRLIIGGENLDSQLAKAIHDKFDGHIELYNEYGPTEATVGCMIHRYSPAEPFVSVPIGIPNANNRLYVFTKQLQLAPLQVWGELYIAGDGLARGYLHNHTLTAERFISHPYIKGERLYRTGDLVRRMENGILEYGGRMDEQVKIRGYRVELADIEHELGRYPGMKQCVLVLKEKERNRQLVAYYIADHLFDTASLQSFLSERLPAYMIPALFVRLAQFPLTTNGKLDRHALPEPAMKPVLAPVDDIESKLAEIWAEVLDMQKEQVSTDINFFELGGDSISILKLNSRINTEFRTTIPVTDMFRLPTIKALQKVIKEGHRDIPQTDMMEAQEDRESIFINRES